MCPNTACCDIVTMQYDDHGVSKEQWSFTSLYLQSSAEKNINFFFFWEWHLSRCSLHAECKSEPCRTEARTQYVTRLRLTHCRDWTTILICYHTTFVWTGAEGTVAPNISNFLKLSHKLKFLLFQSLKCQFFPFLVIVI